MTDRPQGYWSQAAAAEVFRQMMDTCGDRERRPLPVLDWTVRARGSLLGMSPQSPFPVLGRPVYDAWRHRWQLGTLPPDDRDDGYYLRAGARIHTVDVVIAIRVLASELDLPLSGEH